MWLMRVQVGVADGNDDVDGEALCWSGLWPTALVVGVGCLPCLCVGQFCGHSFFED